MTTASKLVIPPLELDSMLFADYLCGTEHFPKDLVGNSDLLNPTDYLEEQAIIQVNNSKI